MERFLADVNGDLSPEDWLITWINVAPHDPTQNRKCSHFSWERGHLARGDATGEKRPRSQARGLPLV
jgi:hypothetical protein